MARKIRLPSGVIDMRSQPRSNRLFPEQLLGDEVQAHELLGGADIDLLGRGIGTDPLDVERLPLRVEPGGRDSLDELVAVVDIEDQKAMAAVLEIVANAGLGHVEQPPHVGPFPGGSRLGVRTLRDAQAG